MELQYESQKVFKDNVIINVQFLSEIRRCRKTYYVMQFVEMVCRGSKDLKKYKYTV
jgi:hypothetical protein